MKSVPTFGDAMMSRKFFLRSTAAAMAILLPAAAFAANGTNFDQLPEPVRKSVKVMAPEIAPGAIKIKAGTTRDTLVEYVDRGVNFELAVASDGTIQRIDETLRYRPLPTSTRNDRITDIASMNEDVVEFALAGDAGRVQQRLVDLKAERRGGSQPYAKRVSSSRLPFCSVRRHAFRWHPLSI